MTDYVDLEGEDAAELRRENNRAAWIIVGFVLAAVSVVPVGLFVAFGGLSWINAEGPDSADIAASQEAINTAFVEGNVFVDPAMRLTFRDSSYYSRSFGAERWVLTSSSGEVPLSVFNFPDSFYEDLAVRDEKLVEYVVEGVAEGERQLEFAERVNEEFGDVPVEELPEYVYVGEWALVDGEEWVTFGRSVACGFLNDDAPGYFYEGCRGVGYSLGDEEWEEWVAAPYFAVKEFFAPYLPENCSVSSEFSEVEPDFGQRVVVVEPTVSFGCEYKSDELGGGG